MTDRGSDLDDLRLSRELATWFAGEVRQAELDLRRAPLRSARARRRLARGIPAPTAGAILVVVLVIAGISRLPSLAGPATEPTGSAAPSTRVTAPEPLVSANPAPTGVIEGRYGDGIPASIDGERVVRPSAIDRLGPADDRSFLLGGWVYDYEGSFPLCWEPDPVSFGPRCMSPYLTETPLAGSAEPVILEGWPLRSGGGPVVLRVHRHDPVAAQCQPARREDCELTAVVESINWAGDEVTAAVPLEPANVFARLYGADPTLAGADVSPVGEPLPEPMPTKIPQPQVQGPEPRPFGGFSFAPCELPRPPLSWSLSGASISHLAVFPSTTAREALDRTRNCLLVIPVDAFVDRRWVRVDNVMVGVLIDASGPTAAQAALIETIRQALEGPESALE